MIIKGISMTQYSHNLKIEIIMLNSKFLPSFSEIKPIKYIDYTAPLDLHNFCQ